jgi:hypothetical protein
LKLTHTLWGGGFNPLIPIGDTEKAVYLAKLFRVDALYPVFDSPISTESEELKDTFEHLSHVFWPLSPSESLYQQGAYGKEAVAVTVRHPLENLRSQLDNDPPESLPILHHPRIKDGDPLRDLLLALIGGYPKPEYAGRDFNEEIDSALGTASSRIHLEQSHDLEEIYFGKYRPTSLTTVGLSWERLAPYQPSVYVGSADQVSDLVNFWNLQALGDPLVFYDPAHSERLEGLVEGLASRTREERAGNGRSKTERHHQPLRFWVSNEGMSDQVPHGLLSEDVRPPVIPFSYDLIRRDGPPRVYCTNTEKSVLGTVTEGENDVRVSFQLPDPPFDFEEPGQEHYIVSVVPQGERALPPGRTLRAPNVPELSEYVRKAFSPGLRSCVVEEDRIGVVCSGYDDHLSVQPLRLRTLVDRLFSIAEIGTQSSKEGRIAERLIDQMGGIQGCRVFKVSGVRSLIRSYGPNQSFTRSQAALEIGEFKPGDKPNLEKYSGIYIEPSRSVDDLGPDRVFDHLLGKGIFQVGIEFECPNCLLDFWSSLDEISSSITCEYCDHTFNPSQKLDEYEWRYRRSGLFGRGDNQGGGIPVSLTLMQIEQTLNMNWGVFVTGTELSLPDGSSCETDFIYITQSRAARKIHVPQIVLSECKTNYPVTENDVENLSKVSRIFEEEVGLESYICFSKIGEYSEEEIERIKRLENERPGRVIILSERELEPYFPFKRASEEFDISSSAVSLSDLADKTSKIYLE